MAFCVQSAPWSTSPQSRWNSACTGASPKARVVNDHWEEKSPVGCDQIRTIDRQLPLESEVPASAEPNLNAGRLQRLRNS
jgi:hypothetical protein